MLSLLWLVPALPLAGFLALIVGYRRLPRGAVTAIGVGSVGAALAVVVGLTPPIFAAVDHSTTQALWTWLEVGSLRPQVALHLDPLSLVMIWVVTGVGLLIHVYSTEYMRSDPGYARFFAYMNLFVAAMLVLVLADNLLLLYLGWEGVGLCSYLLIGFWSDDPANVRAANKAFLVTRVGDAALLLGLFLLFRQTGTLQLDTILAAAGRPQLAGTVAAVAALLLLGGAVGKSGQIPLQVWLPDAMAGPTPVSALIHAATMVTAGVYLVARLHPLYAAVPAVQTVVAVVGALTLLVAGFSALAQRDIKRILAYSTISQIGYMFVALGVGAWPAAIFHFFTHALFKALLFMGAGAIIVSLHHEQDIFRMGQLRQRLPLVFWTFLAGAASLSALPLVSSGFYSKDLILWSALAAPTGSVWLWAAGVFGALLTALYTFRLVRVVFFGDAVGQVVHTPGRAMAAPLVVLAVLSTVAGLLQLPRTLGDAPSFTRFLAPAVEGPEPYSVAVELAQQALVTLVVLGGAAGAWWWYGGAPARRERWQAAPVGGILGRLAAAGCGFDWVYARLVVNPYEALARALSTDRVATWYRGLAWCCAGVSGQLSGVHNGLLRWYLLAMAAGAAVVVALAVAL
jgi:NADH-quinone oxidoreductase subunit L